MSSGCQVDGDGKSGTRMDADKKADCCVLLLVLYARLMREDATAMIETNTLIIGAGPAGLAVAACLKQCGVPFILLEQGERVGRAWHEHYDRLHLHTCLLYTSDAADERSSVDLGGRRIIKNKIHITIKHITHQYKYKHNKKHHPKH